MAYPMLERLLTGEGREKIRLRFKFTYVADGTGGPSWPHDRPMHPHRLLIVARGFCSRPGLVAQLWSRSRKQSLLLRQRVRSGSPRP
jgi:hypothetical protein